MIIFSVMIHVIVFALCAGAIISLITIVPMTVYSIPYVLWIGSQQTKGKYKNKVKNESLFRIAKDSTKLYKSWITRQKPTF